jgi:hypothetical protein
VGRFPNVRDGQPTYGTVPRRSPDGPQTVETVETVETEGRSIERTWDGRPTYSQRTPNAHSAKIAKILKIVKNTKITFTI